MSLQVWIPVEIESFLKRYGVGNYKRVIQAMVSAFCGALSELPEDQVRAVLQKFETLGDVYMVFYYDNKQRPFKLEVKEQ